MVLKKKEFNKKINNKQNLIIINYKIIKFFNINNILNFNLYYLLNVLFNIIRNYI